MAQEQRVLLYLSQQLTKYECPEELRTSLSRFSNSSDGEVVPSTPPTLIREVFAPPQPCPDQLYTQLSKAKDEYDRGKNQAAIQLCADAYHTYAKQQQQQQQQRTEWSILLEVYVLSFIGTVYTSMRDHDEQALLTHWQAKVSMDALLAHNLQTPWLENVAAIHDVQPPANVHTPHQLHDPHPVTAMVYSNLALCVHYMGELELATTLFHHCVNMRFQSINESEAEYSDLAVALNNLGVVLSDPQQQAYAEAYTYILAAHELQTTLHGVVGKIVHPRAQIIHRNLEKIATCRLDLPTVMFTQKITKKGNMLDQLKLGPMQWDHKQTPLKVKLDAITAYIFGKRKKKSGGGGGGGGGKKGKKKGKKKKKKQGG